MPTVKELRKIASGLKIPGRSKMNKAALITAISASRKRKSKSRKRKSRKRKSKSHKRKSKSHKRTPKKKSRRGKSKKGSRRRHKFRLGTKFRMESAELRVLDNRINNIIKKLKELKIRNIKKNYKESGVPGRGGVGYWRDDDTDVLFNALRTAVAKNAAWKARAAMDVEFYKYFEEDLFKEITQ